MLKWRIGRLLPAVVATMGSAALGPDARHWQFAFDATGENPAGVTAVATDAKYDNARGWGFEASGPASTLFSVRAPEGNYRVKATLANSGADTAIKAESRRVYVSPAVPHGDVVEFVVNVHTPKIDEQTSVRISDREKSPSVRHWDDKLTLEFCGKHPGVAGLEITRDDSVKTVFLAGDSTVCDQPDEPWAAWGQLLPEFFGPKVSIANYAESGRTLASFKAEHRWYKILSQLKSGDWVLIQFGHNDMKEKGPGVGAFTTFSDSLRHYVNDARAKGATVVLLTPMHRRKFAGDQIQPTFGDYPEAIRKVAAELTVPLIDLQAMTKPLYESFGPDKSKQLFVYFPAGTFAGQDKDLKDDTHFRAFGADQIARCVVQGIRDLKLPLADDLRDGIPPFDPAHPGDPSTYVMPPSSAGSLVTPEGH